MNEPPLIQASLLAKSYPRPGQTVEVLKGVDLDVQAGESLSVVGASGVGKSTLLHILGTLDRPSHGQVLIGGRDVFSLSEDKLARFRNQSVGFVFQFHHLLPEFNIRENIMMPALVGGAGWAEAGRRADVLLAKVGLTHRTGHRVGEISGGEQQRVAVARALVMEPKLLLADEPTGNLDDKTGRQISELLLSLNRDLGLTLIVATHNLELAAAMRRQIRLRDGRIVEDGRRGGTTA